MINHDISITYHISLISHNGLLINGFFGLLIVIHKDFPKSQDSWVSNQRKFCWNPPTKKHTVDGHLAVPNQDAAMTNKHKTDSSGFVPISYQTFAHLSQVKIDQLATGCIKTGNGYIYQPTGRLINQSCKRKHWVLKNWWPQKSQLDTILGICCVFTMFK